MAPLRSLLEDFEVAPDWIYPTHVERTEELMAEAVDLTRRGVTIDVDTVERDLHRWAAYYLDQGGDPGRLTVSSDASITSPATLLDQLRACVLEHGLAFEMVLRFATSNTAGVLKLERKGRIRPGCDADVLLFRSGSLELTHVFARGEKLLDRGRLTRCEAFLEGSNRRINLVGSKA